MKKAKRFLGIVLAVVTVLTTITLGIESFGASTTNVVQAKVEGKVLYNYEFKVLTLINKERAKRGLSKFKMDKALNDVANKRAAECSLYYSHQRPNGDKNGYKLYKWRYAVGENIALNQQTPAQVVKAWMNSTGHRKNILNRKFKGMGVGCFKTNGHYYWTQFFVDNRVKDYKKPADVNKVYTVDIRKDLVNTFQNVYTLNFENTNSKAVKVYQHIKNLNGYNFTTLILNESIVYKSNNSEIVKVDKNGIVTPKENGETTIIAYVKGAEQEKLTWKVKVDIPEEDIEAVDDDDMNV